MTDPSQDPERRYYGSRITLPVVLERDQHLDVIMDRDGKFLFLKETMPPNRFTKRLPEPTRAGEFRIRTKEWENAFRKSLE